MLYRHSPSRNHRSKGISLKYGIQICLLLAVCFWLIYQIKHSHDKKKEYYESDEKDLRRRTTSEELMKLGRKDIRPRVEDGTISSNENNDDQEDEEENIEEKAILRADGNNDEQEEDEESIEEKDEENKGEDEAQYNVEEKEDEETGNGDDEIGEHEQQKADTKVDREGELVDEEEKEDSAENGTQEMDSEHAHEQISLKDTDHDGDDRSLNEAREENYKADDASSAVAHDIHTTASGNENEHVHNEVGSRKYIEVKGVQIDGDNHQVNASAESKVDAVNNSEIGSSSNDTVTEMFNNHDATSQNATENEPKLGSDQGSLTEDASTEESNLQTIALKGDHNSVVNVNDDPSDSTLKGLEVPKEGESHLEEVPYSNYNKESFASENALRLEASNEAGNNTDSVLGKNDEINAGKSDTRSGGDEALDSTMAENPEDIPHEATDISDASISLEETNTRVDLDTLPEIQTEGTNSEDVAVE